MFGEWKAHISYEIQANTNKVYLYTATDRTRQFLTQDGTIKTYEQGAATGYNDDYFALMTDEQLQAFADGLASKGVKTTNDSKNEGLLEATNKHLEDMRKLVFRKPNV